VNSTLSVVTGLAGDEPRPEMRLAHAAAVIGFLRPGLRALVMNDLNVAWAAVRIDVELEFDLGPRVGSRSLAAVDGAQRCDEVDHLGLRERPRDVEIRLLAQRRPGLLVVRARGCRVAPDDRPVAETRERQSSLDGIRVRVLLEHRRESLARFAVLGLIGEQVDVH
jgi:hypothetical protein